MSEPLLVTPDQQKALCVAQGNTWLDAGDGHPRCMASSKPNWWILIGAVALVAVAVYAAGKQEKNA